jgi:hypothetical protein
MSKLTHCACGQPAVCVKAREGVCGRCAGIEARGYDHIAFPKKERLVIYEYMDVNRAATKWLVKRGIEAGRFNQIGT